MKPGRLALAELATLLLALTALPLMTAATNDKPPHLPKAGCPVAQQQIGHYRRAYTASRNKMSLAGAVPRKWYPCDAARRRAVEWRDKAWQAKKTYTAWHAYNYDWQTWLPWNWKGVARCETHFNFEHNNSRFVSAFGISWREYNADAAFMAAYERARVDAWG